MTTECLIRTDSIPPVETLANFMKTFGAVMKYGRSTLYEGEYYYIPYYMMTYRVEETDEKYAFLDSRLSEDISLILLDEKIGMQTERREVEGCFLLPGRKTEPEARQEIRKKIQMNRKLRKLSARYHLTEQSMQEIWIPEQTFYAKGKSEYLFLVDGFLGKVDFKHLGEVEKRFAENYLKHQN